MSIPQLWKHQEKALAWLDDIDNVGILHFGPGSGKTRIGVEKALKITPALILCPAKAVMHVWYPMLTDFNVDFAVVESTKPVDVRKACEHSVVLINYEKVWRESVFKTLSKYEFKLIVLDEIHRLKSSNGETNKAVYALSKNIPNRLGLTGTLFPNSLLDVHGPMKIIDDNLFNYVDDKGTPRRAGRFRNHFDARYGVWDAIRNNRFAKKLAYVTRQDELQEKLSRRVLQLDTEDVVDLPEFQLFTRNLYADEYTMEVYNKMKNDYIARIDDETWTADNILVKLLRLQQITAGFLPGEELVSINKIKAEAASQIVEEANENIVIFYKFNGELAHLREEIDTQLYVLNGHVDELDLWNKNGGTLCVQIQAGAEMLDLTNARIAIFTSLPHSLGQYEQALARLRRPNSTHANLLYYHLLIKNTVDEDIYKSLMEKQDVIQNFKNYFR